MAARRRRVVGRMPRRRRMTRRVGRARGGKFHIKKTNWSDFASGFKAPFVATAKFLAGDTKGAVMAFKDPVKRIIANKSG